MRSQKQLERKHASPTKDCQGDRTPADSGGSQKPYSDIFREKGADSCQHGAACSVKIPLRNKNETNTSTNTKNKVLYKHLQDSCWIKDSYSKHKKNSKHSTIGKTTQVRNWQKNRIDTSPERIHGWQTSMWQDAQHRNSLGNCKLKRQHDIAIHLSEWLKSESPAIQNTDKDAEW